MSERIKNKIVRAITVSVNVDFFKPIVRDLQRRGYEVVSVSSPGPELEELRLMGLKTIEIPMQRRISILKDIVSLFQIIKAFKIEKPYIVHSLTPKAGLLCMLAAWITRVPRRIHTVTGLIWPTTKGALRWVLMSTDWLTCACATHIIPEGYGVMKDLRRITSKPMKVLGFGNVKGVDLVRFSPRPELNEKVSSIKTPGIFTFLFVGRLVGDKGLNELVQSFERLLLSFSNVRLLLVGKYETDIDPLKSATISKINSITEIQFVGPQFGDDLVAYYEASDCFVFPSYREGMPNSLIEAGAMGLPSIVTDINGCNEIIKNGQNGVLVQPKNVDALYVYIALNWYQC